MSPLEEKAFDEWTRRPDTELYPVAMEGWAAGILWERERAARVVELFGVAGARDPQWIADHIRKGTGGLVRKPKRDDKAREGQSQ